MKVPTTQSARKKASVVKGGMGNSSNKPQLNYQKDISLFDNIIFIEYNVSLTLNISIHDVNNKPQTSKRKPQQNHSQNYMEIQHFRAQVKSLES